VGGGKAAKKNEGKDGFGRGRSWVRKEGESLCRFLGLVKSKSLTFLDVCACVSVWFSSSGGVAEEERACYKLFDGPARLIGGPCPP
jgi:hypothetical protein